MRPLLIIALLAGPAAWAAEPHRAKNVILFIGDAAGIPTIHAASIYATGKPLGLTIHRMPHYALMETATASQWVTDSAASATMMASGQKTHNGVVGQSWEAVRRQKDGEPVKTILEFAEEKGFATGLISNSSALSATPAAFYAHVNDRSNTAAIFADLLRPRFGDGVDVLIGPGMDEIRAADAAPDAALQKLGLRRYPGVSEIPADARRAAVLLDEPAFNLAEATEKAIAILSRNDRGYFLMVESDCHTQAVVQGLRRFYELDAAMRRAMDRTNPEETLILITADHSYDFRIHSGRIGEPLLPPGAAMDWGEDQEEVRTDIVRRDDTHTAEYVLVAAAGPGAERVHGFMDGTTLFHVMMAALGWE